MSQRAGSRLIDLLTRGGRRDPLHSHAASLAGLPELANVGIALGAPEVLCTARWHESGRRVSVLANARLDLAHRFFAPLNNLMTRLERLNLPPALAASRTALLEGYREFMRSVLEASGGRRMELLCSQTRLYGRHQVFLVPAEQARRVLRVDLHGGATGGHPLVESDALGLANAGLPAMYLAFELGQQLFDGGLERVEFFPLRHVWVEPPLAEPASEENAFLQRVRARLLRSDSNQQLAPEYEEERRSSLICAARRVQGATLEARLNSDQPVTGYGYSMPCVLSLLLGGGYGSAENLLWTEDNCLVPRVYDSVLTPPVERRGDQLVLNLRTVLPLLNARNDPLDEQVVQKLRAQPPHSQVLQCLSELQQRNVTIRARASEGVLSGEELEQLGYPLKLRPAQVRRLYEMLAVVYQQCAGRVAPTHWELFATLYPEVALLYARVLEEAGGDVLEAGRRLFPTSGQLVLESILAEDDPIYQQLAGVAEDVRTSRPCEPLQLAQAWVRSLDMRPLPAQDQLSFLRQLCLSFPNFRVLGLRTSLEERPLVQALLGSGDLEEVHFVQASRLPVERVFELLEGQRPFTIALGECAMINGTNFAQIVRRAAQLERPVGLLFGDQVEPLGRDDTENRLNHLLRLCIQNHRFEFARGLVELGASWTWRFPRQKMLLHFAAELERPDAVQFLLGIDGIDVDSVDQLGQTPLHRAALEGSVECARALLDAGAKIEGVQAGIDRPLHVAAKRADGQAEAMVRFLIERGADPLGRGEKDYNILHYAAEKGQVGIAEYILEHCGAGRFGQLLHHCSGSGCPDAKQPLHVLCAVRRAETGAMRRLAQLFIAQGADVNAATNHNYLPVHWAAKHGLAGIFVQLVEAGSDIDRGNRSGITPFDYAVNHSQDAIIQLFMDPQMRGRLDLPPLPRERAPIEELLPVEQACIQHLRIAQEAERLQDQFFLLMLLSSIQKRKGDSFYYQCRDIPSLVVDNRLEGTYSLMLQYYFDAAKGINAMLDLADRHEDLFGEEMSRTLLARLEAIEGHLFRGLTGQLFPSDKRAYLALSRTRLADIRLEASVSFPNGDDAVGLCAFYTSKYTDLLGGLVADVISLLGEPPVPCAIVGAGSMARSEMCRNSDFEYVVLVEERSADVVEYFAKFAALLKLRVINLGETSYNAHGVAINGAGLSLDDTLDPLQRVDLIATPAELAFAFRRAIQTQEVDGRPQDAILAGTLASTSLVYHHGPRAERLLTTYRSELNREMRDKALVWGRWSNRKDNARGLLRADLLDQWQASKGDVSMALAVGFKVAIYRALQQLTADLALYYGLSQSSTIDRLRALAGRSRPLSSREADRFALAYQRVLQLRHLYHAHHRDEHEVFLMPAAQPGEAHEGSYVLTEEQAAWVRDAHACARLLMERAAGLFPEEPNLLVQQDRDMRSSVIGLGPEQAEEVFEQVTSDPAVRGNPEVGSAFATLRVPAACYEEALRLLRDPDSTPRAIELLQEAVDQEYVPSIDALGYCYLTGQGVERAPRQAYALFRQAASEQLPFGLFHQGLCLYSAHGVRADRSQAITLLRRAFALDGQRGAIRARIEPEAASGDVRATHALGVCYELGCGGIEQDVEQARECYQRAADQGYPAAIYNLGALDYMAARSPQLSTLVDQADLVLPLRQQVRDKQGWAAYDRGQGIAASPPAIGIVRDGPTCWMLSLFHALEATPLVLQILEHPIANGLQVQQREALRVAFCDLLHAYRAAQGGAGRPMPFAPMGVFLEVASQFRQEVAPHITDWVGRNGYDPAEMFMMLNDGERGLGFASLPVCPNFWVRHRSLGQFRLPLVERSDDRFPPVQEALGQLFDAHAHAFGTFDLDPLGVAVNGLFATLRDESATWTSQWGAAHQPLVVYWATRWLHIDDRPYREGNWRGFEAAVVAGEPEQDDPHFGVWQALQMLAASDGADAQECISQVSTILLERLHDLDPTNFAHCRFALLVAAQMLQWPRGALAEIRGLDVEMEGRLHSWRDLDRSVTGTRRPTLQELINSHSLAVDVAVAEDPPAVVFLNIPCGEGGVVLRAFTDQILIGRVAYSCRAMIRYMPERGHYVCYKREGDLWAEVDDAWVSRRSAADTEEIIGGCPLQLILQID